MARKAASNSKGTSKGKAKACRLTGKQLNELNFAAEKNKVNKIGNSTYYHRINTGSSSSKYYQATRHFDRRVDPHDPSEVRFDKEERFQTFDHERIEASKSRRTQAQEPFLKHRIIRDEGQEHWDGIRNVEGIPKYRTFDSVARLEGELTDHEKAMEKQRSAQSFQLSSLLIPEAGKTERLLIQNKFQRKNERSRRRLHMFDGLLSLFRDKSRYRHIARENKRAAKRERRRIVVQRGYY